MAPCEHCYVSDEMLAIFAPIAAFWVSSSVYELVAYLRPDACLHSKEEEEQKNVPSRWTVTKHVLFQQAYQIAMVILYLKVYIHPLGALDPSSSSFFFSFSFPIEA